MIPLTDLQAELARRDMHVFLRMYAWPILFPGTEFKDNWHIGAICEHMEAIQAGQIKNLIINIPFRHLKSTIISQTFPAWDWITRPQLQYLTASYIKDLATRDAVASRRIIESEEYQKAYGHYYRMTSDQNVKTRYDNDHAGSRTVTSTDGAATGFGGNVRLIDDPISAKDANSIVAIESSIEWWRGTMATRGNDPATDATVLTHQRIHERDLTGYILAEESGWEHLILPLRYEAQYTKSTCIGFHDPRTQEGELLHPARVGEEEAKKFEDTLGSYHSLAQLQQRPTHRGGVIIRGAWFKRYTVLPTIEYRKIYADTAQKTKERNDYSVFECWGYSLGRIYLLDLIRGKWEAPELRRKAMDFWSKHQALTSIERGIGPLRQMRVEDKSSGTGLIQDIQESGSIPVEGIERNIDKYTRVLDGVPFIEAGLVWVPEDAPWVLDYLTECEAFTADDTHPYDDQIDPTMDAIKDMLAQPDQMAMWARLGA